MAEKDYIEGATGPWEVVIGLEVHAQVKSKAKLFSGASTAFAAEPNEQVSLVDAAFPGMLPVLNEHCVEQAVKTGLGINAAINKFSQFDRKNYFYADLPSGYQISQFSDPIVGEGYLDITREDGETKRVNIERIHLEQDAGKSFHDQHPSKTFIDLNRSGIALMEIVSKPDIRSAEEAVLYLKKLRTILRYLDTSDGNMDEGSLRADVNISVRRPGEDLGTRAEIKNVNSFRFVGQAIDYEVQRQIDLIENGEEVVQETRLFDAGKGITRSMRSKENAHDYRYFPDPDLLPVELTDEYITKIKEGMPELPDAKFERFQKDYALSAYDADILVSEQKTALFFEEAVEAAKEKAKAAKAIANWLIGELFGTLNREGLALEESKVSPAQLASLVDIIQDGTISGKIAKEVFPEMWETGKAPLEIVKEKGLMQVTDTGEIEKIIDEIIANHPSEVEAYKSGKDRLFGFFVGQVMKAMQGKANPKIVNEILKGKLG